jgi:probable rRNA maturation factor
MSVECDIMVDRDVKFAFPGYLADLVRHAAQSEPMLVSSNWEMTLRLVSDDTISDLHERFFADPSPTDVITFPSGDLPSPDGAYLGDVVVSLDTAALQALEGGHSTEREVAFLALHGLLHLCGYDDVTEQDRLAMHRHQSKLLGAWEREEGRPW